MRKGPGTEGGPAAQEQSGPPAAGADGSRVQTGDVAAVGGLAEVYWRRDGAWEGERGQRVGSLSLTLRLGCQACW